ncbi:MAG TPA: SDR family oxidoreductase [Acidobacteriota bacterium]|nr:SDR family oxidoreductase [Acidobacteriota bacterium]
MDSYLVTGGAGFIGSHIVELLVRRGARVRVLDNFMTGTRENLAPFLGAIELVEGDIRDLATCRNAAAGVDSILHQAALASVLRSVEDPILADAVNVAGTLNMLVAARDAGARSFVLASSSAVYGDAPGLPQQEGEEGAPLSPYAAGKRAGEDYCRVFSSLYGLRTAALRYFNVFGPRQDPASQYAAVIPHFIARMLRGEPPVIYGDGEQSRDFIYVGDVAEANLMAAAVPGLRGEAMNIARGSGTTVNALAARINAVLGTHIAPVHEATRPGDVRHSYADISVAAERLGFRPAVPFEEGLERTIRWYRERRDA